MANERESDKSARLIEGQPCPACKKIVRYPLSHVCDARHVDASIVNDVGDYIVKLGGEEYRFARSVFISMVRAAPSHVATPDFREWWNGEEGQRFGNTVLMGQAERIFAAGETRGYVRARDDHARMAKDVAHIEPRSAPSSTRDSQVADYIRRLMHSCPTNPGVVKIACELNALLADTASASSATRLNPLELQHLVDFHDNAAAGSEAQDYFDSARFHEERSKLFKAMLITPDGRADAKEKS